MPFRVLHLMIEVGGGGGVSAFPEKALRRSNVYGSKLLALRGGGWGSNFQDKNVM